MSIGQRVFDSLPNTFLRLLLGKIKKGGIFAAENNY